LTSDASILSVVQGCNIEFVSTPYQFSVPKNNFSWSETHIVKTLIQDLLQKGVIQESFHDEGEFISPIFICPKKNGRYRFILNLKNLNKYVSYKHFKMDTIISCLHLIRPGCYMASLDLTDAYYSVSMSPDAQKYLKFLFQGQLYKFITMPNGLSSSPRIFTKLLKPVYSKLRSSGYISSGYLDDSFLVGYSYPECQENVQTTVKLFETLGFTISKDKSSMEPTHIIEHLGFILNSIDMTISLTEAKIRNIRLQGTQLLDKNFLPLREAAQFIGTLVSCSIAVQYAPLFYKQLEIEKIEALKMSKGNFDAFMKFSDTAKKDILWWIDKNRTYRKPIGQEHPKFTLTTDASGIGWGAVSSTGMHTASRWLPHELPSELSINYLEMMAIKHGLATLYSSHSDVHIKLLVDNMTAVAYINNMGGTHSLLCNNTAREIWNWCIERNIWLTACHIPGIQNDLADKLSRKFSDRTEWKLNPQVFKMLCEAWGRPDIDLFASRHNYQIKPFVSWYPDPESCSVDAMSISWENKFVYLFPPFSMITKILQKVKIDSCRAILIAPYWPTQVWYPVLVNMLISNPIYLSNRKDLLQLPHKQDTVHPLWPKLKMMACLLSGKDFQTSTFHAKHLN